MTEFPIKPLLKWAGGKRSIMGEIAARIGAIDGTYFEPFLGGGALFFGLRPELAVLGDLNGELINCYKQIKRTPVELARRLAGMENSVDAYYQERARRPRSELGRAARLIYLTTLSFNGIYRQNLNGKYNVPYGFKTHLMMPDELVLKQYSKAFSNCRFRTGDFAKTCRDAADGDVVYFDPPYTVAHGNNGFVKYNDKIFSWADQVRLAEFASKLVNRGCKVVVSNADHDSIRELYPSFCEIKIERPSVIAASPLHRRIIKESIFVGCRVR
jgi:DNA adenine methylase